MQFSGLFWFLLMFLPLVLVQRLLHREIQPILFILTRSPQLTMGLFSVLFLPGVFLHELSHFLMAKVLRVPTRDFSFFPHTLPDGRLQMGCVETEETDILRDSLIGLAPLIAGTLFIAYSGFYRLQINTLLGMLENGQTELFWMEIGVLPREKDFFLWFHLAFAVSSTMMPSDSDRHAWLPLGLWSAVLFTLAILSGAGAWMLENFAPFINELLGVVATLFGLSLSLHLVFLLPVYVLHRIVVVITKVDAI